MISEQNTGWLFKRNLEGKIMAWRAWIEWYYDEDHQMGLYNIHIQYGIHEGKHYTQITPSWNTPEPPKYPEKQAIRALASRYKHQLKLGYKDFSAENHPIPLSYAVMDNLVPNTVTDNNEHGKPMKFQKCSPERMTYPCYGQPKINGVRIEISWDETGTTRHASEYDMFNPVPEWEKVLILSKNGDEYDIKHLKETWYEIYKSCEKVIPNIKKYRFDGEAYIVGLPVATIGGACRNRNNPHHKYLMCVVFDIAIEGYSQEQREKMLQQVYHETVESNAFNHKLLDKIYKLLTPSTHENFKAFDIVFLDTKLIRDVNEAICYRDLCIRWGFEGSILRSISSEYAFGQRPVTGIKMKTTQDSEFEILGIHKVSGNFTVPTGYSVVLKCRNDLNNITFNVSFYGDVIEKKRIEDLDARGALKGKLLTIAFYERTKNKIPLHVTSTTLRDYE